MPKPQVRCPHCEFWIPCEPGATKVPKHNRYNHIDQSKCPGSGRPPKETRGAGW